jgi:hypothetical protein
VSSTAQTREEKREEGEKEKERGKFPPLVSRPKTREKRERREKGAGVKREGHALVHVPNFGKKCKCTSVGEIKGKKGWWWC